MALTYNGDLATDLDYIRFKIGDTTASSGPKPSGGNYTDAEINGLLTIEGSANRTIAAIFENLAAIWAHYVDTQIGPRDEKLSQVANRYWNLAKEWRDEYGTSASTLSTGFVTRQDAYSDDIDSGQST